MGTWGLKNFKNDGASDFKLDVLEGDKTLVKNAIQQIVKLNESDYLEAPDCENGLAAIEFIAAAKGNPSIDFSESELEWISKNDLLKHKKPLFGKRINIIDDSLKVLERIVKSSELKELWEESDELDEWLEIQKDLKNRLK